MSLNYKALDHWFGEELDVNYCKENGEFIVRVDDKLSPKTLREIGACGGSVVPDGESAIRVVSD